MLSLVSGCNLVASIASFICIKLYLNSGVSQVRKDSSRTQVHKVAQFYRKRLQEVSERSKRPRTQSLQEVIA